MRLAGGHRVSLFTVNLFGQVQQEAFNLVQHRIDQIFTGIDVVEGGGNRYPDGFVNFGVPSTANAALSKVLYGMDQQYLFTFFRIQTATAINSDMHGKTP